MVIVPKNLQSITKVNSEAHVKTNMEIGILI
jgi:hypothetical protein